MAKGQNTTDFLSLILGSLTQHMEILGEWKAEAEGEKTKIAIKVQVWK